MQVQVLTKYLESNRLYTAVQVESKEGSIGLVVKMEKQRMFSTVNQRLVKVGCAVSSVLGSD